MGYKINSAAVQVRICVFIDAILVSIFAGNLAWAMEQYKFDEEQFKNGRHDIIVGAITITIMEA